jgi:hypothetical protein
MTGKTMSMLETIANGFDDWINQVVFIGGATLGLYVTSPAAPANRPTEDIDCLVNAPGRAFLYQWDQALPERGFRKCVPEEKPAFYWYYQDIRVHLLPPSTEIIGFDNRWFEEGLFHAIYYPLPSGRRIRIFNPVYFLATKFEALAHRGWSDLRMSEDFEDIIYLIENRPELAREIHQAFHEVRGYLQQRFQALLGHPDFEEALACVLPIDATATQIKALQQLMRELAEDPQYA